MAVQISKVHTKADFTAILHVQDTVFSNPPDSFWAILRGPHLNDCIQRAWSHFQASPNTRWIKAVDPSTGQIVGAAEFEVHETNPYEKPADPMVATWQDGAERQDIGTQFLNSLISARRRRMEKPHFLVSLLFVLSEYRGRGVGRKLMEWGLKIADELKLESFVEATKLGLPLYESMGFVKVGEARLDAHAKEPTKEWQAVYDEWLPEPFIIPVLRRAPRGDGEHVEDESK